MVSEFIISYPRAYSNDLKFKLPNQLLSNDRQDQLSQVLAE